MERLEDMMTVFNCYGNYIVMYPGDTTMYVMTAEEIGQLLGGN